jgi:hypothetical protein
MAYQTSSRVLVAMKRESSPGVAATASGATQVRIVGSPGLRLNRARIESNEKRTDALKQMPRLGYKSVDGSFSSELSAGGHHDICAEAILRSAWATATAIGFATMTTVAVGTNEVVAAGGSWLTQGVKVGDIFKLSGTSVAGNHSKNARVIAVTTLTISVPPATFTTLAASATGTLTLAKKVKNGSTPTSYTHTIEQYDQDIDLSELFKGCMLVGASYSFRPGQMATAQYTFLGMDREALASGASPYFSTPALTTSLQLVADDSSIRYNGAAVATFTGFDLNFQITAAGEPVIGSLVTPAIFDNDMMVSGSITGLRSDFSNLTLFDAETEFDVSILLQEPTGTPPEFLSIFLPRVKLAGVSADIGGGDGAKIETLEIVTGPKTAATGYDGTLAAIHSSAA